MLNPNKTSRYARLRRDGERASAQFPALMASAERIAANLAQGVHGRRQAGSGESFWQYRHHIQDDSASRIDWRRSARGDHLFVRESEREAANSVYMWADHSPGMTLPSPCEHTKYERAVVLLIAAASLLVRGGERVAALGGDRAKPGEAGLQTTALALTQTPSPVSNIEAPDLPRHARLLLASDFLDPGETWLARMKALSSQSIRGVMVRVVDPSEDDFPFKGRVQFKQANGSAKMMFGRAQSVQAAYQNRWRSHGEELEKIAKYTGFTLITHRIDQPASHAVLALYQALNGDRL